MTQILVGGSGKSPREDAVGFAPLGGFVSGALGHQLSFNKLFLCKSPEGHKVVGRTQRKGTENKDAQEGSVGWGEGRQDLLQTRVVKAVPRLTEVRTR